MSDDEKPAKGSDADKPFRERKRERPGSSLVSEARHRLASLIWLVAVVCALFLAVGALLIALQANRDNALVTFVLSGAEWLDGPFEDLFTFEDDPDGVKHALVNWGIAAVVYLVAGKVLDRIIRP